VRHLIGYVIMVEGGVRGENGGFLSRRGEFSLLSWELPHHIVENVEPGCDLRG